MNYEIIKDKEALLKFIEWLPELKDGETFYCCLFARNKYCREIVHINTDKSQLKRFTSTKELLYKKIQQLESPLGSYQVKGVEAPNEALVVYINPNPRSLIKATRNGLKRLADLVCQPYNGWNPHQEIMSEIQKAKGETRFVDFDFDCDKRFMPSVIAQIIGPIPKAAIHCLETRGGFHILIEVSKVGKGEKWYQFMTAIHNQYSDDKDNRGDNMIPVAGCTQGGFIPEFKLI